MISIVTTTYNRENFLFRLYQSLIEQSCQDFEWIVIDDGSVDDTLDLLFKLSSEKKLNMRYYSKENGGKHTAINIGVRKSSKEFIFIVDSDDILPKLSIETITNRIIEFNKLQNSEMLSGICFLKADFEGKVTGTALEEKVVCSYLDYRYRFKVTGDKAELFRRKVLLKMPFPEYSNEKFCPEALVWNRISQKYDMYFCNDIVYYCEYHSDGLTSNIYQIRKDSPIATLSYYYELYNSDVPNLIKTRSLLNYWRFYYASNISDISNIPDSMLNIIIRPAIKSYLFLNNIKNKINLVIE